MNRLISRGVLVFAAPLAAAGLLATGASAAPIPARTFNASTHISNTGDSGGSSGVWAVDAYNRKLVITETGRTGSGPGTVYDYTATVDDSGTFQTIKNAGDPNSPGHELNVVTGTLTGHDTYSFTASQRPGSSSNLGVPAHIRRTGAYETHDPIGGGGTSSLATDDAGTSYWYSLAFPSGTKFGGTGIVTFSYTYKTGCETYVNAASSTGNITGKKCRTGITAPSPSPTPTSTRHPHGYTIQAKGHVQSEQSNGYLSVVDGKLVQEDYASSTQFAMVINGSGVTGLEVLTRHGQQTGEFVTIPDSGQATVGHSFAKTTKRGSYYNSADGSYLNNARYSLANGNHQIGWPVKSANEQYTSPGQ